MADSISGIAGLGAIPGLILPVEAQAPVQQSAPAAPAAPSHPAQAPPDLQQVAAALNQYAQDLHLSLHFQVDRTTGQMVLSVIDTQNNQLLLQVPNEEALAIAQSLARMQAQLLQQKA